MYNYQTEQKQPVKRDWLIAALNRPLAEQGKPSSGKREYYISTLDSWDFMWGHR